MDRPASQSAQPRDHAEKVMGEKKVKKVLCTLQKKLKCYMEGWKNVFYSFTFYIHFAPNHIYYVEIETLYPVLIKYHVDRHILEHDEGKVNGDRDGCASMRRTIGKQK